MGGWRDELLALADPRRAEFTAKLTPGKDGIIGARIPDLRALARRISKGDWEGFLAEPKSGFEEEAIHGMVVALAPVTFREREALIDGFLPMVDNWATCDVFCSTLRLRPDEEGEAWDYFASLMGTGSEYAMRLSVVARMSLFRDEPRSRMLLEDLMAHDNPGYYYRMGAAWAVAEVFARHREAAMDALGSGRLEPWTHNAAIRKICESRKSTAGDREEVRALRRNAP